MVSAASSPAPGGLPGRGYKTARECGQAKGRRQHAQVPPAPDLPEDHNAPEGGDQPRRGGNDGEGDGQRGEALVGDKPGDHGDRPHEAREEGGEQGGGVELEGPEGSGGKARGALLASSAGVGACQGVEEEGEKEKAGRGQEYPGKVCEDEVKHLQVLISGERGVRLGGAVHDVVGGVEGGAEEEAGQEGRRGSKEDAERPGDGGKECVRWARSKRRRGRWV